MDKVSKVVGTIMFIPFAGIMLGMGLGFAWMVTSLIPFGGGLIGFFVFLGITGVGLKSFEWSMAFDSSSRELLLPTIRSGFRKATGLNAWQAGLVISSCLFAVGLLWNFVF